MVWGALAPLPPYNNNLIKEKEMSAKADLYEFLFAGNSDPIKNTIFLSETAIPTSSNYPRGTFCVIDYPGNDSNHDIYIYCQSTTDSNAWLKVHDETA